MTTREMIDAIDAIVEKRIALATERHELLSRENALDQTDCLLEEIELLKRQVADGFKEHSAARGVHV